MEAGYLEGLTLVWEEGGVGGVAGKAFNVEGHFSAKFHNVEA